MLPYVLDLLSVNKEHRFESTEKVLACCLSGDYIKLNIHPLAVILTLTVGQNVSQEDPSLKNVFVQITRYVLHVTGKCFQQNTIG
jgi:hypothetical protein